MLVRCCQTLKRMALVFGRPFVKRFTLCYRTVVCLSVLSCPVCNVGVLWPNGCTIPDETWRAGRPRNWPHCVRWGPRSQSSKGAQPPIFGPYLLWPNGSMDQDATWYGGRPRPSRLCYIGTPLPSTKGGRAPTFRTMFIVAKRLDGSRWHLGLR